MTLLSPFSCLNSRIVFSTLQEVSRLARDLTLLLILVLIIKDFLLNGKALEVLELLVIIFYHHLITSLISDIVIEWLYLKNMEGLIEYAALITMRKDFGQELWMVMM